MRQADADETCICGIYTTVRLTDRGRESGLQTERESQAYRQRERVRHKDSERDSGIWTERESQAYRQKERVRQIDRERQ